LSAPSNNAEERSIVAAARRLGPVAHFDSDRVLKIRELVPLDDMRYSVQSAPVPAQLEDEDHRGPGQDLVPDKVNAAIRETYCVAHVQGREDAHEATLYGSSVFNLPNPKEYPTELVVCQRDDLGLLGHLEVTGSSRSGSSYLLMIFDIAFCIPWRTTPVQESNNGSPCTIAGREF
jgi:hypothetical protein